MKKAFRHGEIAFVEVSKLPNGLKKSDSKEIVKGSHSNSHSVSNGDLYFTNENQFVFGYLVAKNTVLLHPEHGEVVKDGKLKQGRIPDGIYQLRKQQEFINNELSPVID